MGPEVIFVTSRLTKQQLIGLGALGAACGGFLCLIAPGASTAEQRAPFRGRYFAHRGLYNESDRPENSLAAFRAAAAAGYGVELDVRLTRDGVAVISHDSDLQRTTGLAGVVEELDWPELQQYRLGGTDQRIPALGEVLDILCKANVPVIVELKAAAGKKRAPLCRKVLEELDKRDGEFCVESFDPMIVAWFRVKAPELLRGQLTSQPEELNADPVTAFLASRVMFNVVSRPQFIAHHVGRRSLSVELSYLMGAMRVTWTARDRGQEYRSDAVIFERFLPPVHYR